MRAPPGRNGPRLSILPSPFQSIVNTGADAASGTWNRTDTRAPTGTHCSGMQNARVTRVVPCWSQSTSLEPVPVNPSARTRRSASGRDSTGGPLEPNR